MQESILIGLIRNIAILITFSILYDHFWVNNLKPKKLIFKLLAGVFLAGVVIVIILTPWNYDSGIFFDTRSVLLSISGLFFGPVPTIIAMLVSSAYRLYIGGSGVYMGIAVILSSGTIGILWNYLRPDWKNKKSLTELSLFGLLVHLVMLACILLLPVEMRMPTLKKVFFSVIIIYPFATVMLGEYIIMQNKARETKRALEISDKRWQFALEGTGDGIWDWNPMTNQVYFSKQWKSMIGYEEHEIANQFEEWERRVHPLDLAKVNQQIFDHANGESPIFSSEYRFLCKDGTYKWILDTGKVMDRDMYGNPVRFIGTHKDISDRKEKELMLANERFLLDSLMNFTPESIYFKDLNSKFIRVNKVTATNFGCENVDDVIGKSDFDFYENDFATRTYNIEKEIIRTGNSYHQEEFGHSKAGLEKWGITNKMPLRNTDGEIIGTFGLSINITERKLAEQALRESEQYTSSILQAIPDLIFILDSNGVYLDFKTGNPKDLALPREQFINKTVYDILPKSVACLIKEKIDTVLKNQLASSVEYQMDIDGESTYFECFVLPFGENRVIAMVRNITERKHVEAELKESQAQLKSYAAHLQDVREDERVLLSREIHDELGQILIALKIDLGIFKQSVFKDVKKSAIDNVTDKFDQIYSLVDKTIKTTRKIMTGLRPEVIEIAGFQEAAKQLTTEFSDRYKINCNFSSPDAEMDVNSQQSIALFRILQEALTNIVKHAKATEVDVLVDVVDNKLIMKITDNGIGLDKNKQTKKDSYGLLGMKERVYLLDGKLTITGSHGKGTTVLVEMPCNV